MNNGNRVIDITKDLKRKEMLIKLQNWWDNNKQYAAVVAPIIGAVVIKSISAISKGHKIQTEYKSKDLRCYDASIGHYWELRRKLTNQDWLYINSRKARGESLGDILKDMNALK